MLNGDKMGKEMVSTPKELLNVGSDIEQHETAVMYESMADEIKLQAILKRGELYSSFDGTQRECGEYFGVTQNTVKDYLIIYKGCNLVKSTEVQEISKNKLLKLVIEHKR